MIGIAWTLGAFRSAAQKKNLLLRGPGHDMTKKREQEIEVHDWVRTRENGLRVVWAIAKDVENGQTWFILSGDSPLIAVVETAIVDIRKAQS